MFDCISLSSGKAEVSAPSMTTAAPVATRQDVYVGECSILAFSIVVMKCVWTRTTGCHPRVCPARELIQVK